MQKSCFLIVTKPKPLECVAGMFVVSKKSVNNVMYMIFFLAWQQEKAMNCDSCCSPVHNTTPDRSASEKNSTK